MSAYPLQRTDTKSLHGDIWTPHALSRWEERCQHLNRQAEEASLRRLGKKHRAIVKRTCPGSATKYMKEFKGRYLMISRNRIVFVFEVREQQTWIITVFPLKQKEVAA